MVQTSAENEFGALTSFEKGRFGIYQVGWAGQFNPGGGKTSW
jgi:hypothetical protein